jgi:hypothetical protein
MACDATTLVNASALNGYAGLSARGIAESMAYELTTHTLTGNPLTDEQGNTLTDEKANTLSDH